MAENPGVGGFWDDFSFVDGFGMGVWEGFCRFWGLLTNELRTGGWGCQPRGPRLTNKTMNGAFGQGSSESWVFGLQILEHGIGIEE